MRKLPPLARYILLFVAIAFVGFGWGIFSLFHMKPSKVVRINGKNPKLEAAIEQAKKGLDGFIKELESPKPDDGFAVKATFQTPYGPEYLWVKHPEFKDGTFSGDLDQDPMALPGKKKGDFVKFAKAEVVDWLIKDDQETRGAFTEKALAGP
jgi:uncharacterized protein YegJ (DUF2314 family)